MLMNQESTLLKPAEVMTDFHIPLNEDQSPVQDSARVGEAPLPSIEEFTYQIPEHDGRQLSSDVVNDF